MEQCDATVPHRKAILFVVDDAHSQTTVAGYLTSYGYDVETASTRRELLQALTRSSFNLVLLETRLPNGRGLAICRPLGPSAVDRGRTLARISKARSSIAALELGADDYLEAPYNPRELLARMRAVLRRSSSDDASEPAAQPCALLKANDKTERTKTDSLRTPAEVCGEWSGCGAWTSDLRTRVLLSCAVAVVGLAMGIAVMRLSSRPDPLDRERILALASRVNAPAGRGLAAIQGGRHFRVELALGCPDTALGLSANAAQWNYDQNTGQVKVIAHSEIWPASDAHSEPIHGFWIVGPRRTLSDCLAGVPRPTQEEFPRARVGLVLVASDARTASSTLPLEPIEFGVAARNTPLDQLLPNLKLVLEGKLTAFPTGEVVICGARAAPADCIVAARLRRASVQNVEAHSLLAQWP
jgi:CheY-like chemotaxis protein